MASNGQCEPSPAGIVVKAGRQDDRRRGEGAHRIQKDEYIPFRVEGLGNALVPDAVAVDDRQAHGPRHSSADGQNGSERVVQRYDGVVGPPELLDERGGGPARRGRRRS
jgi:hypothetical protein